MALEGVTSFGKADVLANTMAPRSASCASIFGSASAVLISLLSLSMISAGGGQKAERIGLSERQSGTNSAPFL